MQLVRTRAEMEEAAEMSATRTSKSGVTTFLQFHTVKGVWYPRFSFNGNFEFYELDATPEVW